MKKVGLRLNQSPWVRSLLGLALATGTLALESACGGDDGSARGSTITTTPASSDTRVRLKFDALGGGSSIIQVFPSTSELDADNSNGTYEDGQSVPAECWEQGRTVYSDPNVGEEIRSSDVWVRIHGSPGKTQYATATYAQPTNFQVVLPHC